MNAKKCKQLRYVAQVISASKPYRAYVRAKTHRGLRLDPACTRARYQAMKKIGMENRHA